MRYEPVNAWMIGHALVAKKRSLVVLVNPAHGVTRHYWIEEVSEEAAKAGYKRGSMVIAKLGFDMYLHLTQHRVVVSVSEVISKVHDFSLDDFVTLKDEPFVPPDIQSAPQTIDRGAESTG